MLIEEAKWLGENFCALEQECFPMVNIGSSTKEFRSQIQPHIDEFIFNPLRKQGKKVLHTDIKDADGVDLVGDLNDGKFIEQIKTLGVKSVLCSNLLEHVVSPQSICRQLENMLEPGGLIIVTVPYQYPYHKDPIDTKFRPSIDELCRLFSNSTLIRGEIVTSPGSQAKTLWSKFRHGDFLSVFNIVKRWILPLHGLSEWRKARVDMFSLLKPYQVTCVVLKRG